MSYLVDLQYSVFTNQRIEPDIDNINAMLLSINALGKYSFFPNVIVNTNIDLNARTVTPINNVSYVTLDQKIQIACLNERIDINIHPNINDTDVSIDGYIDFSKEAMTIIMDKNNIVSNRLALNVSLISDLYENILNTELAHKYFKPLDFYNNNQIEELFSKVNSRRFIHIEKEEMLNVITELSSVIDNASGKKRFLCHMDINTIFEKNEYRFKSAHLNAFNNEIMPFIREIKKNYEDACHE